MASRQHTHVPVAAIAAIFAALAIASLPSVAPISLQQALPMAKVGR
jgi:hypothetical protein